MSSDASIYSQIKPLPSPSPLEQYGQMESLRSLMGTRKLQELQTRKLEGDLTEEQDVKNVFKNAKPDATLESLLPDVMKASPTRGISFQKTALENQTSRATLEKTNQEITIKALAAHRDQLADVNDPQSAAQWVQSAFSDPKLLATMPKGTTLEQALSRIPQDQTQFQQWKQQNALGATKFIELNKPHVTTQDLGGTSRLVATPGLGGAPTELSSSAKTATPDAIMHNATTLRGQNMTDQRAREMNGILEGQGTADLTPTATAIANHDIPLPNPPSGSRNPMAMVRYNELLKKVKEINPSYNAIDYQVAQAGMKAFGTGKQGQEAQAANTGVNHLDTLMELAKAQKNGNTQLFNKIANEFAAQTGQAAPTNLRAALTMVAPEITKAVVGAGGGVEDRNKAAAALNPNYSPDQFLGAAGTMKELFAGRLSEAERTYARTTLRKDFREKILSPAAKKILDQRGAESSPASSVMSEADKILSGK